MDKLLKVLLAIFPVFWNALGKGSKWVFVAAVVLIITTYSLIVSWATIRMEVVSAYDERWYELDNKVGAERTALIRELKGDVGEIKSHQGEMRQDIREMRNALLNKYK